MDSQADIATLEQENRQMRARMDRLESERNGLLFALVKAADFIQPYNAAGDLLEELDEAIEAVQP